MHMTASSLLVLLLFLVPIKCFQLNFQCNAPPSQAKDKQTLAFAGICSFYSIFTPKMEALKFLEVKAIAI